MPIITFRGEPTVEAIADKVYVDLSEPDRRRAVEALVRENPKLERLHEMEPGTVLRIPDMGTARRTGGRHGEAPVDDLAQDLATRLDGYSRFLEARFDEHEKEMERQIRLLSTDLFESVLANSPEAKELASQAKEALAQDAEATKDSRSRVQRAVEKLGKDLKDR